MHKCPKCGCEFEEHTFATLIIDPSLQKKTWRIEYPNIIEGDMAPVFEDGRWWNDWSAYNAHMNEKESKDNAD